MLSGAKFEGPNLMKETCDSPNKLKHDTNSSYDITDTRRVWWAPFDMTKHDSTTMIPDISAWWQHYFEPHTIDSSCWRRWLRWATRPLWRWWILRTCLHYMDDLPFGKRVCAEQDQRVLKHELRLSWSLRSVSYAVLLTNYPSNGDFEQLFLGSSNNGIVAETKDVMACINQTAKLICNLISLYSSWVRGNIFDDVVAPTLSTASCSAKKSQLSTISYERLFHAVIVPTTTSTGTHWAFLDTTYECKSNPHVVIATPKGLYSVSVRSIMDETLNICERYQRIRHTLISLVNREITSTSLEGLSDTCTWAQCTYGDPKIQMETLRWVPTDIKDQMRSALSIVSMQYMTDLSIDSTENTVDDYSKLYFSSDTTKHVWYEHSLNIIVLRDGYSSVILSYLLGLVGYVGAEVGSFLNRPILENNANSDLTLSTISPSPSSPIQSATGNSHFHPLLLLECTSLISPSNHYGMNVIDFERQVQSVLSATKNSSRASSPASTVQSMWTTTTLTRRYCIEHKTSPDGCFWLALTGALHEWMRTQIDQFFLSSLSSRHNHRLFNSMMCMRHFSSLRMYRNGRLNLSTLVGPAIAQWCATGLETKNDRLFRAALAEYSSIMKRDSTFLNWRWLYDMIEARINERTDDLQSRVKPTIFTWLKQQWFRCQRAFFQLHTSNTRTGADVVTSHIRECPGVFMIGRPGVAIDWVKVAGIHYQMFDDVCRIIISPGIYWMPISQSSPSMPVSPSFYEILEQWLRFVRSILEDKSPTKTTET